MLAFLASTGTRIGEALSLRWSDIDLTTGFIKIVDNRHSAIAQKAQAVRKTKGSRSRQVPVHPDLRSELDSLARRADGQVFSAYRGARPDPDRIREQFVKHVIEPLKTRWPTAVGDIGFEHGRLHSFRHYFVSQAFLGGASEGEIREWVGHRDSRVVERYRHLRDTDSLRKMSQLQLLAGAGEANRKPAET